MSSVLESLDYLVLGYLKRTCDASMAEAFQRKRKLSGEGLPELTLEEFYVSNLKVGRQLRLQREDLDVETASALVQRSTAAQHPIPHLPQLVIMNVLSFLPAKDAFQTRILSREWNLCASEYLRTKNRIPITFAESSRMDQFLEILENRPQNWPNVFTAFHLYPERVNVLPLLRLIGRDVRIGIFEFTANYTYSQTYLTFLDLTPNIQELCFYGNTVMDTDQGFRLPGLRTLGLCQGPWSRRSMTPFENFEFGRSADATLDFEELKIWLQLAPGLQELRLNFTVCVNSEFEFARFLKSRGLTHLTLNGLRLQSEVFGRGQEPIRKSAGANALFKQGAGADALFKQDLNLQFKKYVEARYAEEDVEVDAVSNFVASLSDVITRCSVNFENGNVRFPELRRCSYLKVGLTPRLSPPPITAFGFPNLRTVTIDTSGFVTRMHPFRGDVFPTVDTLHLIWRSESQSANQWHMHFPGVTCLRVATSFDADLLRYLSTHFEHVSQLHLCNTWRTRGALAGAALQMEQNENPVVLHGPFSKFEGLLQLDLEEEGEQTEEEEEERSGWSEDIGPMRWTRDIAPLLTRLFALTVAKRLQPLQNLTIRCKREDKSRDADLFVNLLRELDCHKNVNLICQSRASYHKW